MKEADFKWVRQCLISCNSQFQYEACVNLIIIFRRRYIYERGVMDDYYSLMDTLNEIFVPEIREGL